MANLIETLEAHSDWQALSADDRKAVLFIANGDFQAILDEGLATLLPDGLFDGALDGSIDAFDRFAAEVGYEL